MTPTQQVLLNAADLVERGWTQGTFARDAEGQQCKASAREAMCWCASGALTRAARDDWYAYEDAYERLRRLIGADVVDWNDAPERTQAEVVQALRNAAVDGAA